MISEVVISTVRRKSILIKDWLDAFLSIFFPRCCLVCGGVLAKGEECLCARCNMDLPRTNYHKMKDN
ncbi:ComF family protein, partial [Bacteroides salyersiae]